MNTKRLRKFGLLLLFLLLISVFLSPVIKKKFFPPQIAKEPEISNVNTKIDRSFELEAKDKNGFSLKNKKIKLDLVSAEKVTKVARQGTPVFAPEGKAFLILSLEIGNETKETLYFYSAEVLRLVDGEKRFAPDFHNQIVEILPLSFKKDEVAFLVPKEKNQFIIQIQDPEKEGKEEVEISF